MKSPPEKINLRIFEKSNNTSSVDVATLTSLLEGVQKAIFVLAENEMNRKMTREEKKCFTVKCLVPQKGSYSIPVEFGSTPETLFCDCNNIPQSVRERLTSCFRGINENKSDSFNRKELIQVTGNVTYDSDKETPKKITNVDDIQVLDLTEFIFNAVNG